MRHIYILPTATTLHPDSPVCCSALQRVAVCCSVRHVCILPTATALQQRCNQTDMCGAVHCSVLQCDVVYGSVLQRETWLHCANCNSVAPRPDCMLHCVAVSCSVLQCAAVCCKVLQCAAIRCSVL